MLRAMQPNCGSALGAAIVGGGVSRGVVVGVRPGFNQIATLAWPGYWGYPAYPYPYYNQPQGACDVDINVTAADIDALRSGRWVQRSGTNQCGQPITVKMQPGGVG